MFYTLLLLMVLQITVTLPSTIWTLCTDDSQCEPNERCVYHPFFLARSPLPKQRFGRCIPYMWGPATTIHAAAKDCVKSRDCRWYLLEFCEDGQCKKITEAIDFSIS